MNKFLIIIRNFLLSFGLGKFVLKKYRNINGRFKKAKISRYPFVFFGDWIYLGDNYETHIKSFIIKYFSEFDFLVNLGSHQGIYLLIFASYGIPSVGVEPDFRNYDLMKMNIDSNNYNNLISCLNVAISSSNQLTTFYGSGSTGSLNPKMKYNSNFDTTLVQSLSLITVMNAFGINNKRFIFIIDVEGNEFEAISSIKNLLPILDATFIIEVLFEHFVLDDQYMNKSIDLINLYLDSGYKAIIMNQEILLDKSNLDNVKTMSLHNDDLLFTKKINHLR